MNQHKALIVTLCLTILSGFAGTAEATVRDHQKLSAKQAAILPIAAFTAKGDLENLKTALHEGLDAGGMTINEIKEILVQMYAYCGFPRSLNGLNTFIAVLDEREKKGIKDVIGKDASPIPTDKSVREYGMEIQTALVGRPVTGRTYEFAPIIDTFLKEHLFGDIFLRDVLDYQERELATVGALAALPGAENQLRSHLNVSMNAGFTEAQMRDAVRVLGEKVGKPESETAAQQLEVVLKSRASTAQK